MKLLKQILQKRMDLYNEFFINRKYLRAVWHFYSCYNLAIAILNIQENAEEIRKRNNLYKKWFLSKGNIKGKKFKEIQKYIKKDVITIIKAISYIDKLSEEMPFESMNIFPDDVIGILTYEYENL